MGRGKGVTVRRLIRKGYGRCRRRTAKETAATRSFAVLRAIADDSEEALGTTTAAVRSVLAHCKGRLLKVLILCLYSNHEDAIINKYII